ncbi:MAG: PDZ domain-containing protein [Gracilimonas sp.]|nr:PDZ domain-containing protein [Gracilimonas sp.]
MALDLSLRNLDGDKNLDDFMKLMWKKFGNTEVPYTNRDIEATLAEYAGEEFASGFFSKYIFDSQMPDYESLLAAVGVEFGKANPGQVSLGTNIRIENGIGNLRSNAIKGSPVYEAGIEATDEILSIAGIRLSSVNDVDMILKEFEPGDTVEVIFNRWGQEMSATITLSEDPAFQTNYLNDINSSQRQKRAAWLD